MIKRYNAGTHRLIHCVLGEPYYVRMESVKAPGLRMALARWLSRRFKF